MNAAKGLANGCFISLVMWALIAALCYGVWVVLL